jgi:PilZ domain
MSMIEKESLVQRVKRKWKERNFTRAFTRHRCEIDVTLVIKPRMARINGRLKDISQGGGLFRPVLSYLLDRRGIEGSLQVADLAIACRIVRTLPFGYALQFDEPLSDENIAIILKANEAAVMGSEAGAVAQAA